MRFIPTSLHAVMDYVGGLLLIVVPLMLWGRDIPDAALLVPLVTGIIMLLQGMVTDYEYSVASVISMPTYLIMDGLIGIVVAASPWLFGFYESVWIPHVVLGLLAIAAAMTTHLTRGPSLTHSHHAM